MIKRYVNILLILTSLVLGYWLFQKAGLLPSIGDMFSARPVRIDETPILVENIRELAELTTFVSLDEVVADSSRAASNPLGKFFSNPLAPSSDQLVLVVRGQVKAGVRLNEVSDKNIFRSNDSVSVGIPRAVITDVIVNPSGTETFMETGEWSTEAFAALVKKAGYKMQYRAVSEGIIGKSDQRARSVMENFLRQSGFKKVHVYTLY